MQKNRDMIEDVLRRLMRFKTCPDGGDHVACATWLADALRARGFTAELLGDEAVPPVIWAHRTATGGGAGHVVVYGHYDVDEVSEGWSNDPFELVELDGRWVGLGVGDNKGALAARLVALSQATVTPAMTIILQGEEETGSNGLRSVLQRRAMAPVDWYVDENGWRDPNGVERLLVCRKSAGEQFVPSPSDAALVVEASRRASEGDPRARVEARLLNKHFVPGGCAFQAMLPEGARYVAIGTNDAGTRIHSPGESIAISAAVHHAAAFSQLLELFARGVAA